jgi:hypothetical protein
VIAAVRSTRSCGDIAPTLSGASNGLPSLTRRSSMMVAACMMTATLHSASALSVRLHCSSGHRASGSDHSVHEPHRCHNTKTASASRLATSLSFIMASSFDGEGAAMPRWLYCRRPGCRLGSATRDDSRSGLHDACIAVCSVAASPGAGGPSLSSRAANLWAACRPEAAAEARRASPAYGTNGALGSALQLGLVSSRRLIRLTASSTSSTTTSLLGEAQHVRSWVSVGAAL